MAEGAQVSKVTLCVKILKWHSATMKTPRSGIELPGQLKTEDLVVPNRDDEYDDDDDDETDKIPNRHFGTVCWYLFRRS